MEAPADHVLVTIRSEGTEAPLFCVHPQPGNVRVYEDLARHLAPGRPIYGLRSLGPDQRVETMSKRYAQAIREFKPGECYLVVGECKGGVIAYDLAQQLHALGGEVSLLALIDAFPPGAPRLRPFVTPALYRAIHRARILCLHVSNLAHLDLPARCEYVARRARRISRALAAGMRGLGGMPSPQRLDERAFADAISSYEPAPYTGRTVLFRGARLPWGLQAERDLGWGVLIRGLEVEELPAYFGTSMSEPRVRHLARTLLRHT